MLKGVSNVELPVVCPASHSGRIWQVHYSRISASLRPEDTNQMTTLSFKEIS